MILRSLTLCLALPALLAACAHAPPPNGDGGRGTRVTNPRVAPWVFYRGDDALVVGQRLTAGDVLESHCAHGACTAEHRFLSVWTVSGGKPTRVTPSSLKTVPERERRVVLEPGAEFVVMAWSRHPLDEMPRLDLVDGTRKGPHSQTTLLDDEGAEVGVVQWGAVDEVR